MKDLWTFIHLPTVHGTASKQDSQVLQFVRPGNRDCSPESGRSPESGLSLSRCWTVPFRRPKAASAAIIPDSMAKWIPFSRAGLRKPAESPTKSSPSAYGRGMQ